MRGKREEKSIWKEPMLFLEFDLLCSPLVPSSGCASEPFEIPKDIVHFHKYKMWQKFQQGPHDIGCCQKKGLISLSAKVYAQNVALDEISKAGFWKTCWIESGQGEVGGGGVVGNVYFKKRIWKLKCDLKLDFFMFFFFTCREIISFFHGNTTEQYDFMMQFI